MTRLFSVTQLIKDGMVVFLGNVLSQGLGLLLMVVISRDIGPTQLGLFATALAFQSLLVLMTDLGVSTSLIKFVNANAGNSKDVCIYIQIGFFYRLIAILVVAFIGLNLAEQIAIRFYNIPELEDMLWVAFAGSIFLTLHSFIVMYLQAVQQYVTRAVFLFITNAGKLMVIFYYLYYMNGESITGLLWMSSIVPGTISVFFFYRIYSEFLTRWFTLNEYTAHLKKMFSFSIWVFLSSLAVVFMMRIDQFLLLKWSTPEQVGFYSVALQLAMVLPLVTESINTVLLPKASQLHTKESLSHYFRYMIKVVPIFVVFILLSFPSRFIIEFLYGHEFVEAGVLLQWLIIGFSLSLLINPISLLFYSMNKPHYLSILNLIQLIIAIVLNVILIPQLGPMGAVTSTISVRVFGLFYMLIVIRKLLR
jgi:O-antigen/teichoic acid export membrane protein